MFRKAILGIAAVLLAFPAAAQDNGLPDNDYVTDYFGTTLLIVSSSPLAADTTGWWTDELPEDLIYGYGFIAGVINGHRSSMDDPNLISSEDTIVITGWEEEVPGGFQYKIDFLGLRRSEVELLLDALGGIDSILPDEEVSFIPLRNRSFFVFADAIGDPLTVRIGSQFVELDSNMTILEIQDVLSLYLEDEYGDFTMAGINLTYSIYNGYESVDLAFDVELPAG